MKRYIEVESCIHCPWFGLVGIKLSHTDEYARERPFCIETDNWIEPEDGMIPEYCPLTIVKPRK
jgi:hypothetical protein